MAQAQNGRINHGTPSPLSLPKVSAHLHRTADLSTEQLQTAPDLPQWRGAAKSMSDDPPGLV